MSAFVVGESTMNKVVGAICGRGRYGQIISTFCGIDTASKDAGTSIGRLLFNMNVEAVQQRYPDTLDNPNGMPGPCNRKGESTALRLASAYRYKPVPPAGLASWIAAYKAMQCLRYQCSEVYQTPLYEALSSAIAALALHIISSMPEYESASWG